MRAGLILWKVLRGVVLVGLGGFIGYQTGYGLGLLALRYAKTGDAPGMELLFMGMMMPAGAGIGAGIGLWLALAGRRH